MEEVITAKLINTLNDFVDNHLNNKFIFDNVETLAIKFNIQLYSVKINCILKDIYSQIISDTLNYAVTFPIIVDVRKYNLKKSTIESITILAVIKKEMKKFYSRFDDVRVKSRTNSNVFFGNNIFKDEINYIKIKPYNYYTSDY